MSTTAHALSATTMPAAPTLPTRSTPSDAAVRRRLLAGVAAGPVFLGVGLTPAWLREGFDLQRHALSQLSLGTWGFVQIGTFLLSGVLVIAAARGLAAGLGPGRGAVWGPRLLAGFGAGMLMAGAFVADPAFAFPVGTPDGPGQISWHGALHGVGFLVAMLSWTAATVVLARATFIRGQRGQALACGLALLAALAAAVLPVGSFGVRAVLLSAVQLGLVGWLCARQARRLRTP